MNKITIQKISELGCVRLRNVQKNMRQLADANVRFGLLGDWIAPNYQVTFTNGVSLTYRGQNHERFGKDEFEPAHLSEAFTLADITAAYDLASSN